MPKSNGWINDIHNSYKEIEDNCGTYDNEEWINKQKHELSIRAKINKAWL